MIKEMRISDILKEVQKEQMIYEIMDGVTIRDSIEKQKRRKNIAAS